MNKLLTATAGTALLTLISVNTTSAAILSGSGTISGNAYPIDENSEEGFKFFRNINPGDPISGNFSFSYDSSIFNTTNNSVKIPLDTLNLSIGSGLIGNFNNPLLEFIKSGNSFVFNGVSSSGSDSPIPDVTILNNNSLISILDIRTSTFYLTSDPNKNFPPQGGIKQTCQGIGCSFTPTSITSVPETTPTLSLLAIGFFGIGLISKRHTVRKN